MDSEEVNATMEQLAMAGQVQQQGNMNAQAQMYQQEQDRGLAEAQLECERILKKIRHLLKQDVKVFDAKGKLYWKETQDKDRTLTELGVNRIMQTMECYINKESLLSNYDEKIINRRMLELSLALNGLFYAKYELYFRTPTIEEAVNIIKDRIQDKIKIRSYAHEIMGREHDKKQIEKETVAEMEKIIDTEIEKVQKQRMKLNLAEYELLFVELIAMVESVHQRAWKGEERGSLRRHTSISEVIGQMPQQKKEGGFFKWIGG
jgi:hypothetical protein